MEPTLAKATVGEELFAILEWEEKWERRVEGEKLFTILEWIKTVTKRALLVFITMWSQWLTLTKSVARIAEETH